MDDLTKASMQPAPDEQQASTQRPASIEDQRQRADALVQDHAFRVLHDAPVTDEQKADAWQHFHDSKSGMELVDKLVPMDLPTDLKHKLFLAKIQSLPTPGKVERAIAAIVSMSHMDKDLLDKAEKNSTVLKLLSEAMMRSKEKE